jgi:hypothetical protein
MPVTINGSGSVTGVDPDSFSTGLQHIATKSFSAVSSVSVNSCFTSEFDTYRVIADVTCTADVALQIRLRLSGTDNTSGYYAIGHYSVSGTGPTRLESANQSAMRIGSTNQNALLTVMDLMYPASAIKTRFASTVGGNFQSSQWGGFHDDATAYDGFSLFGSSGTVTGTIRVYGYMNGVAS